MRLYEHCCDRCQHDFERLIRGTQQPEYPAFHHSEVTKKTKRFHITLIIQWAPGAERSRQLRCAAMPRGVDVDAKRMPNPFLRVRGCRLNYQDHSFAAG